NLRFAQGIRRDGIKVPLTITLDHFILSGHRRYWAAGMCDLEAVPCVYEGVTRLDENGDVRPDFLAPLARYNDQRVKTAAEMAREAVVTVKPAEAHRALLAYRQAQARGDGDDHAVAIEGTASRSAISGAKMPMLDACQAVLMGRRRFWPLTTRQ